MKKRRFSRQVLSSDLAILFYLASIKLVLHFLTNSHYGYFTDELYYIACGEHLDWGYVDQPPLIAVVAKLSRWLMGDSLFALRFFPAVAGAALVFLTGLIVRELGGGRFAQLLAALAIIIAPIYLAFHTLLTMNAFDPLCWTLGAYLIMLIIKHDRPRLWLLFGVVAGVGLMNKYSVAFFGFGIVVGLLLTPQRQLLFEKWVWLGGFVALVIFLPHLSWELKHGWATFELLRNAHLYLHYPVSPAEFLWGQVLLTHPLTFPIWLAGLYFYFYSQDGQQYRALGWAYVIVFGLFVALKGKVYYLAPAYPVLLAAGAIVTERFIRQSQSQWLKPAAVTVLLVGGVLSAPYTLPVLPVDVFLRYENRLGIPEVKAEKGESGRLPQNYAYMFGWENLAATVAKVYHSLSPEEQRKCAIWASDYGQAGAIDFFGRAYHLPEAISGYQNYYLWGPRDYTGELMIAVGFSADDLRPIFDQVGQAAFIKCEYCWPDQDNLPVYLCRGLKTPLQEFWPRVKCYSCDRPPFAVH